MLPTPRERRLLATLRQAGPLSRRELHERTGWRPNTVGSLVGGLLERGLLCEGEAELVGRGRPRVPVTIDPGRRAVLGMALEPGQVSACRLNLLGERIDDVRLRAASDVSETMAAASELLATSDRLDQVIAVGLSVTGFVDPVAPSILLSSAMPAATPISLEPVHKALGDLPLILENDMHALAAQWSLTHAAGPEEDILLVLVRDGAIGAAVLVDGRPNRGCVVGGNELGHTRFFIDTDRCYCGQVGCLERIVSSAFLHQRGVPTDSRLFELLARDTSDNSAVQTVLDHLAIALSNAVNFIRPNRLVIVSELADHPAVCDRLTESVRSGLLSVLASRVGIETWNGPDGGFAETAGWLALASLYRHGWQPFPTAETDRPRRRRTPRQRASA
ncbi:ROK family protein [Phycisphaerales bacterium AB-hyl4]|uniref:ROK family protein n=1 Tax=Natronomicrosphaera hydrolytica TaxID=3242702 RepID=A0ABV4U1H2_9BACT